jgi:predicted sugar kinase
MEQELETHLQDKEEEKYTTEEKAEQEKCMRLLPAMIESLIASFEEVLQKYQNYLENYWHPDNIEKMRNIWMQQQKSWIATFTRT